MKRTPVTIGQIAEMLGVSKSTVSRALKNHPDIGEETTKRVHNLAQKLHYRPNATAMSFRYRSSKLIGLIMPTISHFFFPSVIQAIEEVVHQQGYSLMIMQSNESYQRERENLEILIANNVEGILASVARETTNFSHFAEVLDLEIPLVFFDRVPAGIAADSVTIDDTRGAWRAVSHLIEVGKSRIAICIGNPRLLISQHRLEGYKQALADHNIPFDANLVRSAQSSDEAADEVAKLLGTPTPPDGLFCISDLTMSGAMRSVYASGLHVPEQLAVIGFCESPFDTMYQPALSIIRPMGHEIGREAARRLFLQIHSSSGLPPETLELQSELVIRTSTAPQT